MTSWNRKTHLAGRKKGHATLCNAQPKSRWKKMLGWSPTQVKVVSEHAFAKLTFADQCGRCFIALCAREGTPMVRQR